MVNFELFWLLIFPTPKKETKGNMLFFFKFEASFMSEFCEPRVMFSVWPCYSIGLLGFFPRFLWGKS